MNEKNKRMISKFGEEKAELHLISKGYRILKKNYFSAFGEIDILCLKEKTLVFCEVKTRTSFENDFDLAYRAVSVNKQKKMKKTALYFLSKYPQYEDYFTSFDVIAIIIHPVTKKYQLEHLQEAFS
jgi:putative endonuclease